MVFTSKDDPQEMMQAVTYVAKYTGLVVLNTTKELCPLKLGQMFTPIPKSLLLLSSGLHEIGEANDNSVYALPISLPPISWWRVK